MRWAGCAQIFDVVHAANGLVHRRARPTLTFPCSAHVKRRSCRNRLAGMPDELPRGFSFSPGWLSFIALFWMAFLENGPVNDGLSTPQLPFRANTSLCDLRMSIIDWSVLHGRTYGWEGLDCLFCGIRERSKGNILGKPTQAGGGRRVCEG